MATLQNEITIGGLPAEKFIGRQIKVDWKDKFPHPSSCRCVDIEGNFVVVLIGKKSGSGNRTHRVPAHDCRPWWTMNPDLKAEAEALGALYTGEVSVGRAFEVARTEAGLKPEEGITSPFVVPSPFDIHLAPVGIAAQSEPGVESKPTPPEPVVETKPIEPVMETKTEPPVMETNPSPRKLIKMEIPSDGDGSWLADMQEYYRVRSALEVGSEDLDALRLKIEELKQELVRKEEEFLRGREDNKVMLDLLIEQLESEGVVFHWDSETAPVASTPPVAATPPPPRSYAPRDEFSAAMQAWVKQQTQPFTFFDLFKATGEEDTAAHRLTTKRYCLKSGMTMDSQRGPGKKTTFTPTKH